MKGFSWVNFVLFLCLIGAPFALQYSDIPVAMRNNMIVGMVIASLAIFQALEKADMEPVRQHHSAH